MLRPVLSDKELRHLEHRLRTLKRKQDKLPNKNGGRFQKLDEEITKLHWEIEEAKAIRNNTYSRFKAERTVWTFVDNIPDKILFRYLQKIGMNTLELIDAVEKNPDFIKETYNDQSKWLPIVRIEEDMVFVKTLRGIEPVRKTSEICNDASVGDYALCRSVRSRLFMFDYNKEVKA